MVTVFSLQRAICIERGNILHPSRGPVEFGEGRRHGRAKAYRLVPLGERAPGRGAHVVIHGTIYHRRYGSVGPAEPLTTKPWRAAQTVGQPSLESSRLLKRFCFQPIGQGPGGAA